MRTAIIAGMLCLSCGVALAEIDEGQAVKAIIGESLHTRKAYYAMACALRNRDKAGIGLRGVYGVKAKHAQNPSQKLKAMALEAWRASGSGVDVVRGASHWLSDYDLGHCRPERMAWRFGMVETAYVGQTHFYGAKGKI